MRLLVISGSLRSGSFNTSLARAAADVAPAGVDAVVYESLRELPLYDEDLDDVALEPVERLRAAIRDSDAVLFVTPEYNGSVSGVLKNAIDWASRPKSDAALRGKTTAVAGASTGQYGALWAQQDLRRILGIAGARVIEGELSVPRAHEAFDETGALLSPMLQERLRAHVGNVVREAVPLVVAA